MKHVPNALTVGRMVAAPVCLYLLAMGGFGNLLAGTVVFVVAAITDWLDGRLARQYGASTRLGRFLDPLADKVLVLGAFALVPFLDPLDVSLDRPMGAWLPWGAIGAIGARDVAVTLLRSHYERRGRSLKTLSAAKWKTAWQLTFLISVLVFVTFASLRSAEGWFGVVGEALYSLLSSAFPLLFLLATAAVTVYTGVLYFTRREEVSAS